MKKLIISLAAGSALLATACTSNNQKAEELAARGEAALSAGDNSGAVTALKEATRLRDDNTNYWILLGRAQIASGNYSDAYSAYKRAHELDKSNIEILSYLAEISLMAGQFDDASRYADDLLVANPDNLRAIAVKGFAAQGKKHYDQAIRIADSILAQSPDDSSARLLKARALIATNNPLAAIKLLEPLTKTDNANGVLATLVEAYRLVGDGDAARTLSERLSKSQPDVAEAQFDFARQLYLSNNAQAAGAVVRAIKHDPYNSAYSTRLLTFWMSLGSRTSAQIEARDMPADASPAMRTALARYALFQGQPKIAIGQLRLAVPDQTPNPTNAEALGWLTYAEVASDQVSEAMALADKVLKVDPENPGALLSRARVALSQNRLDDALRDSRRVLKDAPNLPEARILVADYYVRRDQVDRARQILAEGLELDPQSVALLAYYTRLLVTEGRADLAAKVTEEFVAGSAQAYAGWEWRRYACSAARDGDCLVLTREAIARLSSRVRPPMPAKASPEQQAASGLMTSPNDDVSAPATSIGGGSSLQSADDAELTTGADAILKATHPKAAQSK